VVAMASTKRTITIAGRVYYISLPIKWIRAQRLRKGDKLVIHYDPHVPMITITPER